MVVGAVFVATSWHHVNKGEPPVVVTCSLIDLLLVAFVSPVLGSEGPGNWSA